jgi:hypothetical protein
MIDPSPELPNDTLVEMVRFPTLMREALAGAGLRTVGWRMFAQIAPRRFARQTVVEPFRRVEHIAWEQI